MSKPVVLVIDAGLGNVGSVVAALQREDCIAKRLNKPLSKENSAMFTHVILPGVGSFSAGMKALKNRLWDQWLHEIWCTNDRPLLGICLGMQLLASEGTEGAKEDGSVTGLGLIPGRVDRMRVNSELVLPHVGWNEVWWNNNARFLADNLTNGSDMYFVHSYTFRTEDSSNTIATSEYGENFTAAVGNGNCYGVQFHPEKSQGLGRRLLQNFLAIPTMLKQRVIPKLQLGIRQNFRGLQSVLVVTNQFNNRRAIGDPLSQAKIYEAQLADELILIDLERSEESWPILLETLELISEALATPLVVGGGVKNYEQVQALLDRGADKILINSGALDEPKLINKISNSYGNQCVIVGIDIRSTNDGEWIVWADGGRKYSGRNPIDWSKEIVERGAGELLVTDIDLDGTGKGLNLSLIRELKEFLSIPLIASGGCGLAQHFVDGYQAGAQAVAAGTFFCQRDQNPMQCRSQLLNSGINIRNSY